MSESLSRADLLHLCKLAKLEIAEDQEAYYLSSLNKLLDILDQLQKVNLSQQQKDAYIKPNLKERKDVAQECSNRESCEKQAPSVLSHFYVVPQVIE